MTTHKQLNVGVIGCGFFGGLHAKKHAENPLAKLIGVFDPVSESAQTVAANLDTRAYADIDGLLADVDAVSITAPAAYHYDLAAQALRAGKHVLVEKPIALDVEHADELIALAQDKDVVLQVGHQERYVFEDFGVLGRDIAPTEIRARRAGPFTGRAMDVSAVFDLMIHDLDLIHQVNGSPVKEVSASAKTVHGEFADEVDAHLILEDGCQVRVLASRIADERQRDMRLVYPDGVIEIDFINRTISNTTNAELRADFEGDEESQQILNDPLGYGIRAFVDAARLGHAPRITGGQARRALETAIKITEKCAA